MFNVRLADGHLYGKQLFTLLSLVVSLMAFFVLSFFPLDVLDEIWDLIESVSEGFLTYSLLGLFTCSNVMVKHCPLPPLPLPPPPQSTGSEVLKNQKIYNLHYDDVRGDILRPPPIKISEQLLS